MTSRAVPVLAEAAEHKALPPLDDREREDCIEIGAGNRSMPITLHSLAPPVRATMGQPFFALLVGVWMREQGVAPRAPIDLMATLGERATKDLAIDEGHLRELAVRSVARELGPVPAGDVLKGAEADELLATGVLERRAGGLAFVLPAMAQWFAARALLLGETSAEQLLAAPENLELWRYPLALAISLGSAGRASELVAPLLSSEAGFGLRTLDATFGQAVLGGGVPPPWREGGEQAREALQRLADALGPLAPIVCEADAAGRVRPMAVSSGPSTLTVAFWKGVEERPYVFPMPANVSLFEASPDWGTRRGSQVGPGAAWAWDWALKGIHRRLDHVLRDRALPVAPLGPLGREAAWAAACDLVGASVLVTDEIALEPLASMLEQVSNELYEQGPVVFQKGLVSHDLRGLRLVVIESRARGDTRLVPRVPPADLDPGGGIIGEFYSDKRLVEVATRVYEAAVAGYRELVERWMPTLASQLEHRVLMPLRVVGFVNTGRRRGSAPIPHLAGYIEALLPGANDEIQMEVSEENYDFEMGNHSHAQQRAARPEAARWLTGTHGSMSLDVGTRYPISDAVYSWIGHDLKRLGLVGGLPHSRSGEAIVPYDL